MTWGLPNTARERGVKRDCQHQRTKHQHGTNLAYLQDKCDCPDCHEAHRQAGHYYKLHGTTKPLTPLQHQTVPIERVSRLVLQILEQTGLKRSELAHECGWHDHGTKLWRILSHDNKEVTMRTYVRLRATARRLGVDTTIPPTAGNPAGRGEGGRRLQALARRGYSLHDVARATGRAVSGLAVIRNGKREPTMPVLLSIRDAYNQLMPEPGPMFHDSKAQSDFRAKGWLPAGAWEDIVTGVIDPDWDSHYQYRPSHHQKTA